MLPAVNEWLPIFEDSEFYFIGYVMIVVMEALTVPFLGLVLNLKLPSYVLTWSAFNGKIVFLINPLLYHLDTSVCGSQGIPGLLGLVQR